MTHRALISALTVTTALALAACGPGAEPPADAPATPVVADPSTTTGPAAPATGGVTEVLLEGDGIMPANPGGHGTGRKLTFGEPRAAVVNFLTGLHGGTAPTLSQNGECGAGPLDFAMWDDDLTLAFQDGQFAGWWAGDQAPAGFSTIKDIHVGSTLAEVRAAWPGVTVMNDSIGPEFHTDSIAGTLTGTTATATVTALWAGVSCIFR